MKEYHTSVKKNPELDFDKRKIQIVSKHFGLNLYTTLEDFVNNFPNIEAIKNLTNERTNNA